MQRFTIAHAAFVSSMPTPSRLPFDQQLVRNILLIPSGDTHSPNSDAFHYLSTLSFFSQYLQLNMSFCIKGHMCMYITSYFISVLVSPSFSERESAVCMEIAE
jgi:hypothetical protein